MVDMALDTHAFVKTLTAAGMPEVQAEAVTTIVTSARATDELRFSTRAELADLATKSDLAALRAEMATKADLKAELAAYATKADLKAELAAYPTKVDLKAELAAYATKADLVSLEGNLKLALAETKSDLQKWTFGMVGGAVVLNAMTVVGALLALAKMFGH
jgi:hypothetical protein